MRLQDRDQHQATISLFCASYTKMFLQCTSAEEDKVEHMVTRPFLFVFRSPWVLSFLFEFYNCFFSTVFFEGHPCTFDGDFIQSIGFC